MSLLANQHTDDPLIVTPDNTAVVCFGVPRSGSTYVWQLISDVFKRGVIKTHGYLPASKTVPTICVYRDFRDSAVSGWRHLNPARERLTKEEIRELAKAKLNKVAVLNRYAEHVPPSMLLRFETFIVDPAVVLRAVREVVDVDLCDWQASLVEHSLDRNRRLSENEAVPSLLLCRRHVQGCEVGAWRKWVDRSDADLLTALLLPALTRWEYEA